MIKNYTGSITVYNPEFRYDLNKEKIEDIKLNLHQSVSYSLNITKPTQLVLYFLSNKFFNFSLFLSPGDDLYLTADFINNKIIVTGKGSNNNQPEIFALTNMDTKPFKGDTSPDRVITALNKQLLVNRHILSNYIKANHPSNAFIKNAIFNLTYFVPLNYYEFNHNNNFGKQKKQLLKWQRIQDSIFSTIKLSNDDALSAYNYRHLIDNFLIREPEGLAMEYRVHRKWFLKQWFRDDTARGAKIINSAEAGILNEKVIDKYFKSKAAEQAYGQAIKQEYAEANCPSAVLLYNHLKKRYPTSQYVKSYNAQLLNVINKQHQVLNSKIIFAANNGADLKTFNDVLKLFKGKVTCGELGADLAEKKYKRMQNS